MEKLQLLYSADRNVKCCHSYGKQYETPPPQKKKTWFCDPTYGYVHRLIQIRTQRSVCTPVFIAALFIIAEICKQLMYTDWWIDKEKCGYTHINTDALQNNVWMLACFWFAFYYNFDLLIKNLLNTS